MKNLAKAALRPVWWRIRDKIETISVSKSQALERQIKVLDREMNALRHQVHLQSLRLDESSHFMFASDPSLSPSAPDKPFMAVSNCQGVDFHHPRYLQLCKLLAMRPQFHRKQWEWVYVLHQLLEAGILKPGARGLGFGVGKEPLPAAFASMGVDVTATDAPMDVSRVEAWSATGQHSGSVDQLLNSNIAPDDLVRSKVSHQACDMNHIDPALQGYDFNWSSCCFEHLGNIELGLQFVVNAVEKTLRVGGVAVHTTEFNVSSNEDTVTEGDTVIFRLRDMEELVRRLRDRGHEVQPFIIGPTAHALDYHVDVPPYAQDVHLKLRIANYVATSAGIVVRRGGTH
jgi:hypothetical protein